MEQHEPFVTTLEDLIGLITDHYHRSGCHGEWWQTIGEDFPDAESAAEFLAIHGRDLYRVTWPGQVITPRFNGDASYHPHKPAFEVVFLNNGDAVLQTGDGSYAAVFADMEALGQCVHALMKGESAQGWDGHDPANQIDTDTVAFRKAVRAGGYTHFDNATFVAGYNQIGLPVSHVSLWDHAESSWGNVSEFVLELWHCVKQAEWDELQSMC